MNDKTNTKIGKKIERLRILAGDTMEQLGNALGVSDGVIYHWEAGDRNIKADAIVKLAKHFGVSADYLLGLTDAETPNTEIRAICDYTGLSEAAIETLRDLADASPACKEVLNKMITSDLFKYSVLDMQMIFIWCDLANKSIKQENIRIESQMGSGIPEEEAVFEDPEDLIPGDTTIFERIDSAFDQARLNRYEVHERLESMVREITGFETTEQAVRKMQDRRTAAYIRKEKPDAE